MFHAMRHLAGLAVGLGLVASSSVASADVPKVGEPFAWPTIRRGWVDDPPNASEAAGRVVIHWFCSVKAAVCRDDLARLVNLRENNSKVYVIAYISDAKNRRSAQRLDPIREEPGTGAVAYGKEVDRLAPSLGLPAGGTIVVDVDGRAALVGPSTDPDTLDKRDAKVRALADAIREYKLSRSGPSSVKVGDRFSLEVKVELATWLSYDRKAPFQFVLNAPGTINCTSTKLGINDVRIDGRIVTGAFSCTATKSGNYELTASLRFGFGAATRGTGVGSDSARWKFQAK